MIFRIVQKQTKRQEESMPCILGLFSFRSYNIRQGDSMMSNWENKKDKESQKSYPFFCLIRRKERRKGGLPHKPSIYALACSIFHTCELSTCHISTKTWQENIWQGRWWNSQILLSLLPTPSCTYSALENGMHVDCERESYYIVEAKRLGLQRGTNHSKGLRYWGGKKGTGSKGGRRR